jgi:hypothetical protein
MEIPNHTKHIVGVTTLIYGDNNTRIAMPAICLKKDMVEEDNVTNNAPWSHTDRQLKEPTHHPQRVTR